MQSSDYVLEVFRTGSFTAAAANLYVSQPALSMAIKKIESELGIEIFDRRTSPVRPTEGGMIYIEALQNMDAIRTNMQTRINDLLGLRAGHVNLGGAHFISAHLMPEVLIAFSALYPGVKVGVTEGSSHQLQEYLNTEKLDLVLDYGSNTELFEHKPIFRETILITVPRPMVPPELCGMALTRQEVLDGRHLSSDCPVADLRAFSGAPFLLLKRGNDMNAWARKLCREADFQPRVLIYLDQMMTSYNLSQKGMGISFVTDTVIRKTAPENEPLFFRITSAPAVRTLFISWKKNRYVPLAAREFIRLTEKTLAGAGTDLSHSGGAFDGNA